MGTGAHRLICVRHKLAPVAILRRAKRVALAYRRKRASSSVSLFNRRIPCLAAQTIKCHAAITSVLAVLTAQARRVVSLVRGSTRRLLR